MFDLRAVTMMTSTSLPSIYRAHRVLCASAVLLVLQIPMQFLCLYCTCVFAVLASAFHPHALFNRYHRRR